MRRFLGAAFALSSLVTPYFLGAVVGGVASGRVPPGIATGDVVTSWVNPTSMLGGVLAVLTCAYLAAVFLCARRAARRARPSSPRGSARRALGTAAVTGLGRARRASSCCAPTRPRCSTACSAGRCRWWSLSVLAGRGLDRAAGRSAATRRRGSTAALAVATILIGWAAAQYPYVLPPDLTIADAAAGQATLVAMLVTLVVGSCVLVPALVYLYRLFQRSERITP